jgi:hypothetical protein
MYKQNCCGHDDAVAFNGVSNRASFDKTPRQRDRWLSRAVSGVDSADHETYLIHH